MRKTQPKSIEYIIDTNRNGILLTVLRTRIPRMVERLAERLLFVTIVTHTKLTKPRRRSQKPKLYDSSPNCLIPSKNTTSNSPPGYSRHNFCFWLRLLHWLQTNTPRAIAGTLRPQWLTPPHRCTQSPNVLTQNMLENITSTLPLLILQPTKNRPKPKVQLDRLFERKCWWLPSPNHPHSTY